MSTTSVTVTPPVTGAVAPPITPPPAERPAWLPEGFSKPEDLVKSYTELKTKSETPPAVATPPNLSKFEQEFAQTGKLSDASYTELEKSHGLNKAKVDAFIEGQKAAATQFQTQALSDIGGRAEFDKISAWATKALTPADLAAYNAVANSNDLSAIKLALAGLKQKYTSAMGQDPNLVSGGKGGDGSVYRSTAELMTDMQNPKYRVDPAFRQDVQEKLSRSNILGTKVR